MLIVCFHRWLYCLCNNGWSQASRPYVCRGSQVKFGKAESWVVVGLEDRCYVGAEDTVVGDRETRALESLSSHATARSMSWSVEHAGTQSGRSGSVWRGEPAPQHLAAVAASCWMGGPSSHLTADNQQTVVINISEKNMPAGSGRVRRGGFDPTDPQMNGDFRRPRRRLRKR